MALPIFAITIFVSAFLLFLVQPLVGKLILPKLGGTPQVWNTCMVFFQSVLLLGYAYTHSVSTRLKLRQQLLVHAILLALPVVVMFVFPMYVTVVGDEKSPGWTPPPGANPILETLVLLFTIVGVPFFVVSTSAPLLQKWFGYSGHHTAKDPYFLYSVSNLGSLLSLFFYPALIEPSTYLQTQTFIWFGGYVFLAACILYCAYTIFQTAPPDEQIQADEAKAGLAMEAPPPETPVPPAPAAAPAPTAETAVKSGPAPGGPRGGARGKKGGKALGKAEEARPHTPVAAAPTIVRGAAAEMTWWRRIRWVLLAAVPSSMMLGVTSYISTDLSPFPLVWVIPLALYLLSFILVYEKFTRWTEKRYQVVGGSYTLHQMMVFVAQPLGILIIAYIVLTRQFDPVFATFMTMIGFFANALACHGELAEDRPDPKHLTEYFLLMSFGGMVGGFFNGIIAPVVFQQGILEFYIVIVVACMVRPQYVTAGWFDDLILNAFPSFQNWVRGQGDEMAKSMGRPTPNSTYLFSTFMDIVFGLFILSFAYWLTQGTALGWVFKTFKVTQEWRAFTQRVVLFGIPMVFCFFFAGRPLRMGLSVMGLLLGIMYFGAIEDRNILESRRTYFGVLRVEADAEGPRDKQEQDQFFTKIVETEKGPRMVPYEYTFLMHGTTYHGRNYKYDKRFKTDLSRLATTYYHRYGPVGVVMEIDNWFKGPQNSFSADARLPAALIGDLVGATLGNPFAPLCEVWSEPPFATIGLGTGTMASYARPYQHMTYYEIDDVIRGFSIPEDGGEARFTFLEGAIRRGVNLEVIMGDARLSLEPKREPTNKDNSFVYYGLFDKKKFEPGKVPDRPYAELKYEHTHSTSPNRQNYYKVINVDAFSSDAIPVHLVTKQAIAIYMDKLRDDGVLCVHTSNRHMDLVRPVARIALELSEESQSKGGPPINVRVGKDPGSRGSSGLTYMGHFGSEYVMIYRGDAFEKWLDKLEKDRKEMMPKRGEDSNAPNGYQILNSPVEWYNPFTDHTVVRNRRLVKDPITKTRDSLWTDDFSNILSVLRWHWPWE